ncbi:DUF2170 family protein [Vibrio mangrovi]|uniref:DUF2170 family protein n=1 Tax=Vibrio mangrovi TaxID=474394 RepID=A0A1Y6IML3_9VIBR|nr:DUF2170 family protein [Vibrio mangrovi]MDW6004306.1 DUF2170 family protein [Vibrio mangrovi]SMR98895.1 hypothetical protein VIM7927_00108 [Vibrio mangrovi]
MWQIHEMMPILQQNDDWQVQTQGDTLIITNADGLQAYIAVAGEQILAEVVLFSAAQVKDSAQLNALILKTHKMFPLSTIAINEINHTDYYVAFGALSSQSKAESILIEVETLFRNVEAFIELYQEELVTE